MSAWLCTALIFISLSSSLPVLSFLPANVSSSPFGKYLINYCSDDHNERMSISIELARLGAFQAYHDATGENIFGFESFFKSKHHPVITILEEIAQWQPLGMLTPRFACVNEEASAHFSEIWPSIMDVCRNPPTAQSIFIPGHNYIFICPATWALREETKTPDHSNCPEVEANQYTEGIIRYRSNVILDALVKWRLQRISLPLPDPSGLNAMVGLSAQDSYLSPKNYDAYISMVRN